MNIPQNCSCFPQNSIVFCMFRKIQHFSAKFRIFLLFFRKVTRAFSPNRTLDNLLAKPYCTVATFVDNRRPFEFRPKLEHLLHNREPPDPGGRRVLQHASDSAHVCDQKQESCCRCDVVAIPNELPIQVTHEVVGFRPLVVCRTCSDEAAAFGGAGEKPAVLLSMRSTLFRAIWKPSFVKTS